MSILIKDMEMPNRCYECEFSEWSDIRQTMVCNCGSYYFKPCFEDHSKEFFEKRADFCPLVEIPVPHGRLIDADALDYKLGASDMDIYVRCTLEEDAPTIIEAEGRWY